MIIDLKPYPKMKDSGVEWLGKVPEHWKIKRLKSSVNNVIQQTVDHQKSDLYVAMEHVESWTGRLILSGTGVSFDSQLKRFRPGDVLFGKLRPYLAKVTRPLSYGVCVGEFLVLRPRNSRVTSPFLEQVLRSKLFIDAVNISTFGAKMPRADWRFIGGMAIGRPPLPEQTAIVRFLDYADQRIRRYIRAKQKLITLLEEQKQAIIHQAVTGQIDVRTGQPYPAYKDSGLAWLGKVPEHWEARRLKTLCNMQSGDGITSSSIEPTGKYPVYGGNGLRGYTSNYTHEGHFALIGRQGALCGNVHIASGRFWASEHAIVVTVICGHDVDWFGATLDVMDLNQYSIAAAQPGLSVERVLNLHVAVPSPEEQAVIAAKIAQQTSCLDASIHSVNDQIELFKEYRTRLIADVVTGKLDVREAVARLSDETETSQAMDWPDAPPALDKDLIASLDSVTESDEPPAQKICLMAHKLLNKKVLYS